MGKQESIYNQEYEATVAKYLPLEFRDYIEQTFYQKVTDHSDYENLKSNVEFLKDPENHIGLYSDHGVVHVRDVSMRLLKVMDRVNGLLIPERKIDDLEFIKGYGLLITYLHDIGMSVFSANGRFMHPEFAAQYVFSEEFDDFIDSLWAKNAGNVPRTITEIFNDVGGTGHKLILREILCLSLAHSKSKVPIELLNNPSKLQTHLKEICNSPLELLLYRQKIKKLEGSVKKKKIKECNHYQAKYEQWLQSNQEIIENKSFSRFYTDTKTEAFTWLTDKSEAKRTFTLNVIDAIRCLRSADALRQRGTVLRTSAGYEIFSDRSTSNAIYALRSKNGHELVLLESKKALNAGEANIASSHIDSYGNLRISFHIGSFVTKKIAKRAAAKVAEVIDDIQADTIASFLRGDIFSCPHHTPPRVKAENVKILIEDAADNPNFAGLVSQAIRKQNPNSTSKVEVSFSLHGLKKQEVMRYLEGENLMSFFEQSSDDMAMFKTIIKESKLKIKNGVFPGQEHIKVLELQPNDVLIQAGSISGFVYYPMSKGLRVDPMGGYDSIHALPWVALGITGVIRSSIRNADVIAEEAVNVICIPKRTYLAHWYQPIPSKGFKEYIQYMNKTKSSLD